MFWLGAEVHNRKTVGRGRAPPNSRVCLRDMPQNLADKRYDIGASYPSDMIDIIYLLAIFCLILLQ
jgi:hypothetical protein